MHAKQAAFYNTANPYIAHVKSPGGERMVAVRTSEKRERTLQAAYAAYMREIVGKVKWMKKTLDDHMVVREGGKVADVSMDRPVVCDLYSVNGVRGIVECLAYACVVANIELVGREGRRKWKVERILRFLVDGRGTYPVARDFETAKTGVASIPVPQRVGIEAGFGADGSLSINEVYMAYLIASGFQHMPKPFDGFPDPCREDIELLFAFVAKTRRFYGRT